MYGDLVTLGELWQKFNEPLYLIVMYLNGITLLTLHVINISAIRDNRFALHLRLPSSQKRLLPDVSLNQFLHGSPDYLFHGWGTDPNALGNFGEGSLPL